MSVSDRPQLNLLYAGYFLLGEDWSLYNNKDDQKYAEERMELLSDDDRKNELIRSQEISDKIYDWAIINGYGKSVEKAWWINKRGDLSRVIGRQINENINRTKVLLQFNSGPADGYLGLTSEATGGNANIGLKNPNIEDIEKALGLDLYAIVKQSEGEFADRYGLSQIFAKRKVQIQTNPLIKEYAVKKGDEVIQQLKNAVLEKLNSMSNIELRDFLLQTWLEAADQIYPPFIKAVGLGVKPPFTARLESALFNPKLKGVIGSQISVVSFGRNYIGIKAADKQILRLEIKYKTQKMASPIEMTGMAW